MANWGTAMHFTAPLNPLLTRSVEPSQNMNMLDRNSLLFPGSLLAASALFGAITGCGNTPATETTGAGGSGTAGTTTSQGGNTWTERNECEDGSHACDANATCEDTKDFYLCTCNEGYEGDGTSCTDINECALGIHDCAANSTCTNTSPGYSCKCEAGFIEDDTGCAPQYLKVSSGSEHSCAELIFTEAIFKVQQQVDP